MKTTLWREVRDADLASMTEQERAEYDAAAIEAELALDLAEKVCNPRKAAGLSKAERARRMGTAQPVISQIEVGGQSLSVVMPARAAHATGQPINIRIAAA
jgi:ribosome-binding protein aMBF1 (putative translation factor)